jgi:hypothetical protein
LKDKSITLAEVTEVLYDEEKYPLEEKQKEETGELSKNETTNQVF